MENSSISEPRLTHSKCRCGHPACNRFHIDQSGANGMFDEETARRIVASFNALAGVPQEVLDSGNRAMIASFLLAD